MITNEITTYLINLVSENFSLIIGENQPTNTIIIPKEESDPNYTNAVLSLEFNGGYLYEPLYDAIKRPWTIIIKANTSGEITYKFI
jgi:hypothetical protein